MSENPRCSPSSKITKTNKIITKTKTEEKQKETARRGVLEEIKGLVTKLQN